MVYEELWGEVIQGVSSLSFMPGKSGLVKLDQLGKAWDRFKIHKAHMRYATNTGTTVSGAFILGVDYSAEQTASTKADVLALDPRCDGPLWENMIVRVDPARAMSKISMACNSHDSDNVPFVVSMFSSVPEPGLLWCSYDVEFSSPAFTGQPGGEVHSVNSAQHTVPNEVTNDVIPVGKPISEVRTEQAMASDMALGGAQPAITSTTTFEKASLGQQLVATSVAPEASLYHKTTGALTVTFKDASTGLPLPGDVVKHVQTLDRVNGFFSSAWKFVKPWVKPFVMTMVETFLVADSTLQGADNGQQTYHLVTDKVISDIKIDTSMQATAATMCSMVVVVTNVDGSVRRGFNDTIGLQFVGDHFITGDRLRLKTFQAMTKDTVILVKTARSTDGGVQSALARADVINDTCTKTAATQTAAGSTSFFLRLKRDLDSGTELVGLYHSPSDAIHVDDAVSLSAVILGVATSSVVS